VQYARILDSDLRVVTVEIEAQETERLRTHWQQILCLISVTRTVPVCYCSPDRVPGSVFSGIRRLPDGNHSRIRVYPLVASPASQRNGLAAEIGLVVWQAGLAGALSRHYRCAFLLESIKESGISAATLFSYGLVTPSQSLMKTSRRPRAAPRKQGKRSINADHRRSALVFPGTWDLDIR
jgi:hypothetical protein